MNRTLVFAAVALAACDSPTGIVLTLEYDALIGRAEVAGHAGLEEIIPPQTAEDLPADRGLVELVFVLDERHAGKNVALDVIGFDRKDGVPISSDAAFAVIEGGRFVRAVAVLHTTIAAICGDGLVELPESCDDGNDAPNDGCEACLVSDGWICSGACTPICGDGVRVGPERCDDGNRNDGDGCNSSCEIELGFSCDMGSPSICTTICGDGRILGDETCDDRNSISGDGCSSTCTDESGFLCSGEPSRCCRIGCDQCAPGGCCIETCGADDCTDNVCPPGCSCEIDCRAVGRNNSCGGTCLGMGTTCRILCDGVRECDQFSCGGGASCKLLCNNRTHHCEFDSCSGGSEISCGERDLGCGPNACSL